jgi:hypothetical protein
MKKPIRIQLPAVLEKNPQGGSREENDRTPRHPQGIDSQGTAEPTAVSSSGTSLGQQAEPAQPPRPSVDVVSREELPHLRVEMDQAGHAWLTFLEGEQTVKHVALSQQAFQGLIEEGLLRQPRSLEVGALRNWVKLDGELFRFEGDPNGASGLEEALNERYVLPEESSGPNVLVFANPASPTGFDLQFPASPLGFAENRRRHLNQETVGILQDPQKCRVLRKGRILVLAPPQLIFKRNQPGGSEAHLESGPPSQVLLADGRVIDLSQPVDLLHVQAEDLAAVFNHPALNRQAVLAQVAAARRQGREGRRQAA